MAKVERLILCSGKVYFDLLEERRARGVDQVALVRVEELYPYPAALLQAQFDAYPDAEVCWVQEEPRNMGAWPVYCDWLREQLPMDRQPRYIGRLPAASPAPGYKKASEAAQARFIDEALTVSKECPVGATPPYVPFRLTFQRFSIHGHRTEDSTSGGVHSLRVHRRLCRLQWGLRKRW